MADIDFSRRWREPYCRISDFNLRKEGYDVIVANDGEALN